MSGYGTFLAWKWDIFFSLGHRDVVWMKNIGSRNFFLTNCAPKKKQICASFKKCNESMHSSESKSKFWAYLI